MVDRYKKDQGFTLLEVLVALVIIAISLTAMAYAISRNAQNATYLDQKTAAHWVAMNVLSKAQVLAEQSNFTGVGLTSGSSSVLGHRWYWQSKTDMTMVEGVYKIQVKVSASENSNPIEQLQGYLYHAPISY